MDGQKGKVSSVFRELADVFETFETEKTDLNVTHATPVEDNLLDTETVSVEVGTRIPFLEHGPENAGDTGISLTPTNVHLDTDGSLLVELQATVEYCSEAAVGQNATRPGSGQDEESNSVSEGEESSEDQTGGDTNPKPTVTTETDTTDKKQHWEQESKSTTEASHSTNGDINQNQRAEDRHTQAEDSETEQPPYRDPERLKEVYEKYDTFDEMTDALEVDVTAQTVRRYMIEHDIHTPASETGSRSAEVLLNMDPDAITDKSSEDGSESETRSHPSNRPTFEKPT